MSKRKQALLIITGCLLFLIVLIIGKIVLTPKIEVCDHSIKSKTVILIDHSEPVPQQTINEIVSRAWNFIDQQVQEGELISIFTLTQLSKQKLVPSFSACKPKKEGNMLYEDANKIRIRFKESFEKPLKKELSREITGSDESPLAQALIDLSLSEQYFRSPVLTRLLIFSDLLENTPKFSMYKNCNTSTNIIQLFRNSRIGAVERPTFKNTLVYMHIIPRNNISRETIKCRDLFWIWFFGDIQGDCRNPSCLIPENLPG